MYNYVMNSYTVCAGEIMDTGERLRELREAKGLSQEEVAKAIGVGRVTYLKYENGENRPVRKLKELSSFFNVSIDYLLGNESPKVSKRDMNDLAKFLNKTEVLFDGDTYSLSEEDQQKLRSALEFVFWDAKRQNKRKKD